METDNFVDSFAPVELVKNGERNLSIDEDKWNLLLYQSYIVLSEFAVNGIPQYIDIIERRLAAVGVRVSGSAGVFGLCSLFDVYETPIECDVGDRSMTFSFKETKKRNDRKFFPFKWHLLLAVAVVSFFIVLMAFKAPMSRVDDSRHVPEAVQKIESATPVSENVPVEIVEGEDLESLFKQGALARILDTLDDLALHSDDKKEIRARINRTVYAKSDSLGKAISSLMSQDRFAEAFALELKFDKDVFSLCSGRMASRNLRSRILTAWVVSLLNKRIEKSRAIEIVSNEIAGILGSDKYFVAKKDNGHFYLEYCSR